MFGGHCLRLKELGTLYPHIGISFFFPNSPTGGRLLVGVLLGGVSLASQKKQHTMFGGHCLRLKELGTLYPHIGISFFFPNSPTGGRLLVGVLIGCADMDCYIEA
ncbi:hypothetical protein HDF26_004959 [Pedobacter cryoconitis]|uniref:Uncharacterized protein n=1 Tax=Pedobacter cryoconitis TaxID=188932 RepID=A0A7W8ZMA5_9SPHI|nr:hypothetical protein [Pedobacter cryoconitis]MBB6274481.1 hypothetical protein [Pedobacter cryoconitis]